ncbi:MAG: hypothetical protein E6J90_44815 [Deltaproteobacteria bacterium]|nr:MAG: hypothetical protein E6J90_44815 [Deltaproteobacteria bacterium]TMQ22116.1 MAG: hypothetical protein E6J91_01660 [Deltaproteobacteria bacterium]
MILDGKTGRTVREITPRPVRDDASHDLRDRGEQLEERADGGGAAAFVERARGPTSARDAREGVGRTYSSVQCGKSREHTFVNK